MSLRALANRWLRRYGLELVLYTRLMDLLKELYESQPDFFFVQIGANDGVKFDDFFGFVTSRRCSGLVVEPLTVYFQRLKKNYKLFPQIIPVNVAIHKSDKTAKIYYVDPDRLRDLPEWAEGIGSLIPDHHKRSGTPGEYVISEEVPCMTFAELMQQYNVKRIDYLQLDVEGYDGEVLKLIDFDVFRPRLIKYERVCLSRADEQATEQLLKDVGYQVYREKTDNIAVLS